MGRPDFPRTIVEFQERFSDEAACLEYLAASRWPEGYRCPVCGGERAWVLERRHLWECARCHHQTSVTAGTVMHRTRTPLRLWFWAAYLVATHTPGISAKQLQRQLGISPLRDRLADPAEAAPGDGRPRARAAAGRGRGRRDLRRRAPFLGVVAGASARARRWSASRSRSAARARAAAPERARRPRCEHARRLGERDRRARRDRPHRRLERLRQARPVTASTTARACSTCARPDRQFILPRAHRAISNLKTWLQGTHRGVSAKHLQVYLDEFVFRHNRRRTPMAAFQTLLGLGALHEPTTYREITGRAAA